jgi:PAS domain-containing protein
MGAIIAAFETREGSRHSLAHIPNAIVSRRNQTHHPELRRLRLLLTCDYGRPKFIKFILRVAPICGEMLRESQLTELTFTLKFLVVDDLTAAAPSPSSQDLTPSSYSDLPIQLLVNSCLTSVLVLVGITYFTPFIASTECEDWIRYQQLLTEVHSSTSASNARPQSRDISSHSDSTRALSQARQHALVQAVSYDDIIALMNKPQWIVTFARCLDQIPFPVSIHAGPAPPAELQGLYVQQHVSPALHPLLYANFAFLEMTGYTNKQLGGSEYNFLELTEAEDQSNGSFLINNAMRLGRQLRIGRTNRRHIAASARASTSVPASALAAVASEGEIFHNFQSYQPLHDGVDGVYQFMIVIHCDLTHRRNDSQYLHKINLFAESLVPSHMPCSLDGDAHALLTYFYQDPIASTE